MSAVYNNLLVIDPHNYPKVVGDVAKSWKVSGDYRADVKASWDKVVFPGGGASARVGVTIR
jgi:hypothetical protein